MVEAKKESMYKATVSMDEFTDEDLPCYTDGQTWNSFGMPWFDAEGVQLLKALYDAFQDEEEPPTLLVEGDSVKIYDSYDGAYTECTMRLEVINGVEIKLWSVGEDLSWNRCERVIGEFTVELLSKAVATSDLNEALFALQNAVGIDCGGIAGMVFGSAWSSEWPGASPERRLEMMKYYASREAK